MTQHRNFLLVPHFELGRYRCHVVHGDRVVHRSQGASRWIVALKQGERWVQRQRDDDCPAQPPTRSWLQWREGPR